MYEIFWIYIVFLRERVLYVCIEFLLPFKDVCDFCAWKKQRMNKESISYTYVFVRRKFILYIAAVKLQFMVDNDKNKNKNKKNSS